MKACKQLKLLSIVLVFLLSACSSTQQAYKQNITLYLASHQGVALSNEEVTSSPADLIYVKNGERPVATMALAFIENGHYKWLSSDDVMIITAQGRLVRTVGFNSNLVHVSNLRQDPIISGAKFDNPMLTWSRRIDTDIAEGSDYGALINSQLHAPTNTSIMIQNIEFSVRKVEETVSYTSALYGAQEWINTFWFDNNTNQLLQSSQTMAPYMDALEITYLSRALRLLENNSVGADK